jgi:hypothetical protein
VAALAILGSTDTSHREASPRSFTIDRRQLARGVPILHLAERDAYIGFTRDGSDQQPGGKKTSLSLSQAVRYADGFDAKGFGLGRASACPAVIQIIGD